jgi:pimeloyl-ACP methyl ester carboxylesterase
MFYEVLGEGSPDRPPWLMIHGGAGTGAVFRLTVDGRPGWADALAGRGHEVWLADWPGVGRSGSGDPLLVAHDTVVDAFVGLIENEIGRPVLLLGHSMGASVAWRVAERLRPAVAGICAIAPAPPGNLLPRAQVVSDDGTTVLLAHPDADAEIPVRVDTMFVTPPEFVEEHWIAPGTRLPREYADAFRASIVPMPPLLTLQRLGGAGGVPAVSDAGAYEGLWIRVVTAPNDPTHTRERTGPLIDLLRSWGADAELVHLGDRGIDGNGHFMFLELNSDDVLDVLLAEVGERFG